jgi:hypothetical protein
MNDRIMPRKPKHTAHAAKPNAATEAAIAELADCYDLEEFALLRGHAEPLDPHLLLLAGRGGPRVLLHRRRRP